jgi:flagellar hook-basal body complex protein FliE
MMIDPTMAIEQTEWTVPGIGQLDLGPEFNVTPQVEGSSGFGSMLGKQIGRLQELQDEAATQGQALASGNAADPTSVVMAVDRARLSMQLASQLRERGTTALTEVLRTQV